MLVFLASFVEHLGEPAGRFEGQCGAMHGFLETLGRRLLCPGAYEGPLEATWVVLVTMVLCAWQPSSDVYLPRRDAYSKGWPSISSTFDMLIICSIWISKLTLGAANMDSACHFGSNG